MAKSTQPGKNTAKASGSELAQPPTATVDATVTTEKPSKKDKKRKRDDEPAADNASKKKSKRKAAAAEEAIVSGTAVNGEVKQTDSPEGTPAEKSEKSKSDKSKKSKKSKKAKGAVEEEQAPEVVKDKSDNKVSKEKKSEQDAPATDDVTMEDAPAKDTPSAQENENKPKESKKKSRKQRAAAKRDSDKAVEELAADGAAVEGEDTGVGALDPTVDAATGKKYRFVVFVGNLPYTVTKEDLEKHFEKVAPKDARIMTDKVTKKSRGFAFLEFDRYDKMEQCLKSYHHSVFADGKKGRKINVELTAGGGGNTESRKSKIFAKNEKLAEERERDRIKREEIETKQRERAAKKEARGIKSKRTSRQGEANGDAAGNEDAPAEESAENGIHPARLAMMNAPTPKFERRQPQHGGGRFQKNNRQRF